MKARVQGSGRLAVVLAVVAVLAATLLKWALNSLVGEDVGFLPALGAVVVSAWLGGFIPGLVATVLAMLLESFLFLGPAGDFHIIAAVDRMRLALFGTVGALTSWLAWLRVRAEAEAREAQAEAEHAGERIELAMRRLSALQDLAAELAGALTREEITDALLTRGIASLGAEGAAVFILAPGGSELEVIGSRGYGSGRTEMLSRLPLDNRLPATDAVRTSVPVYIEEPAQYVEQYGPSLASRGIEQIEPLAVAAVPMDLEGRKFGAIGFTWGSFHPFPEDRRTFISALARLGAGALERARLSDGERTALRRAEAAQQSLDLLAATGRVLGLSLDYEATLERLAGLALPLLGEVCVVDVLEAGGVRRIVATVDPADAAAAETLQRYPVDPASESPIAGVIRAAGVEVFQLDEAALRRVTRSAEHADAWLSLGGRWALVAPLRVLGRTIGVLTFVRRDPRGYDETQIAIAVELGDRAGRALENARLHAQIERLADRESRHAAELEAVIGAIGEGIIVADGDGTVRSLNGAAVRLLGGRPVASIDELLGRLRDSAGETPRELGSGPAEYQLSGRSDAWIEMAAYPVAGLPGAGNLSTVLVCRDVTAFRQGQGLREAFLSLLSHELRTPVTTIYGGSSLLTRPGAGIPDATRGEILADIAGESNRLYRLVEDLLVLARFDEGLELGAEPSLLQHLVPSVVALERVRWPAITFDVQAAPDLPAVSGDETSIQQVVRNLLSNAAKYSEAGSVVEVRVDAAEDGVAVCVRDHGAGIDPEEAESLFNPFYRSPATAKMAGGAGIGLYVSRRLIDAMGGRIWARPAEGGGSEFTIVLTPYRSDQAEPDERLPSPVGRAAEAS